MPYTPYNADWKDSPDASTPITQAALEYIEGGIVTAQAAAEAAIAKSIVDAKGDLIVASAADTVARLAVGAQGYHLAVGAASALEWAQPVGYGTSLPGSPYDGQEYILVDSTTAPTYQWRFRYNASNSTSYKWEFIGGAPVTSRVNTGQSTASTTATDLATVGPSFTAPRAGVYLLQVEARGTPDTAGGYASLHYKIGSAAAADFQPGSVGNFNSGSVEAWIKTGETITVPNASDVVKIQYSRVFGANATFAGRSMSIIPIRVA